MIFKFMEEIPKDLKKSVEKLSTQVSDTNEFYTVIQNIYDYAIENSEQLARKKIKACQDLGSNSKTIFQLKGVSVLSPIRKKLDFAIALNSLDNSFQILFLKDNSVQFGIQNLNTNIKFATFLPAPEKENIVYLIISYDESFNGTKFCEPILIALNKTAVISQLKENKAAEISTFQDCRDYIRKQAILTGFRIADTFNNNNIDTESISSFYVNCHRTTKEGTLYFLPDNIIFGFKKPILIFNTDEIDSITYSSITRLTFNVTLVLKSGEKYEFSMIDQAEYGKIDQYVKSKEVKDKSMSEELKAKIKLKSNINSTQGDGKSALVTATNEINNGKDIKNINSMNLDSDDDAEDENFVGESDLSDGSEITDMEKEEEEGEEGEEEEETNEETHNKYGIINDFHRLKANEFDINIEDEEDDENSGAEYD
ncbi:related to Histone chaperone RTT106 [Saccharomycodes ludwigii]|uniref:Histone chaperone RTT106 n=1 Tax=Saccharomycodes ludwigii TaxID=36035 RepID=A0A376BB53_9ASCO|nr:hypothetical protein SCDLUD_003003 [Saccharomycodes ludwigii]KAH3901507.1 hypothetical protein SCDLUD_003003 [Saccharomycodes ludwigii]SSD61915.1 related to Histone chaperone RTT106 [Saccharomycodes ludwigii]